MILVTLGTQDKPFTRLLDTVEKAIEDGYITEKVVVQAGLTQFQSDRMEVFDFLSSTQFDQLLAEASLLICHGGVGTISGAVKKNIPVIAAPRLKEYGEHTNNHQIEIIKKLSEANSLIPLWKMEDLKECLEKAKTFKPEPIISNTPHLIEYLKQYLDQIK